MAQKIRLNVAGVIVRDGKLLLVEFNDDSGLHYNLPGGGVEIGEPIEQALRREVREECHAEISTIGRVLMIWEYIDQVQNYQYGEGHKVAMVFECQLQADSEPHFPPNPDLHQTGIRWVALDELEQVALIPAIQKPLLDILANASITPVMITQAL